MSQIIVIGHGMVGSRFAEDIVKADPDARVLVLGKEPVVAYNRVLLSSVVAGTKNPELLSIAGPKHPRIKVLTGISAKRIEPFQKVVVDDNGARHPYDTLVLATGSTARVAGIRGVATESGGLAQGCFVLKDMSDAQGVVAAAAKAKTAVVLGAGVLGMEVATGLAARGLSVRLVHVADRLMERQLGWDASSVVESSLRRRNIETHTSSGVLDIVTRRGRITGVRLEGGLDAPADLLVMCIGTVPETTLARGAGLRVERGVVVDDALRTSDPDIYAIGDCAQPPEGSTGLVAQGWDQSTRLVRHLASMSSDASVPITSDVVRVKASGMAMVAMGICGDFDRSDPRYRVLSLKDPEAGRFVEVVVSGGLLVGATCIGDADVAATLSALYTRSMPVPNDPAHLMIRALAGGGAATVTVAPEDLEDSDKVCNCNTVTAGRIRQAIHEGCATVGDVAQATRATTGCGDCTSVVRGLLACASSGDDAEASRESVPVS